MPVRRAIEDIAGTASPSALASGIRSIRQRARMTVAQLALKAKLDKGYISRIERGEKAPSISALLRIAEALDVGVGHLFGETATDDAITVVRSSEYVPVADGKDEGDILQAIFPSQSGRRLSAFVAELGPNATRRHEDHPGDEMMFVLSGEVEVNFPDRTIQLSKNDSVYFDGHLKHKVRRLGRAKALVLIVIGQDLGRSGPAAD